MNPSALAYRLRVFIFVALYLLGFFPPWLLLSRAGGNGTLWLAASTLFARAGFLSLAAATLAVTLFALACLVLGAILRVWGTAYIGSSVMRSATLRGEQLVASGPYRYVRNPLYLGTWMLAIGASILMPASGAAFFVPVFSLFILFLISTEERFLSARLRGVYEQYRQRVPRLLPRIGAGSLIAAARPRWLQALLVETYPIAFTLCFAIFAWRYNARILIQCLLICYGSSLVIRAFIGKSPAGAGA